MRRLAGPLLVLVLVSGCVAQDADPTTQELPPVADVSAPAATAAQEPAPLEPAAPLLVNMTGELRKSAAELTVPAGTYRLVHLVYDNALWGEASPWDGDAAVSVGLAWDVAGDGVVMHAFGFAAPSFAEPRPIRPYVDFAPVTGKGWTGSSVFSSCSGCEGDAPRHEAAWLIGGTGPSRVRIGVVDGFDGAEALWDRPAVAVRADAETKEAFAGFAVRATILAEEFRLQGGIVQATWDDTVVPGLGVQRKSSFTAQADAVEPGISSVALIVQEQAGVDDWTYHLDVPGLQGEWSGPWVHEPSQGSYLLTATGQVQPPLVRAQGNIGAGRLEFEAARTFTGFTEPTGLVRLQYEAVTIGHAGVDLDALFGWETSVPPAPDQALQVRHCVASSLRPDIRCADA